MSKVAILFAHSQYRFLFSKIAEKLRSEHGWTIHLYCNTPQEAVFYKTFPKSYDSVTVARNRYQRCAAPITGEAVEQEIRRARALEDRLGISLGQIVMTDRHFGRAFSLGGGRHPRSNHSRADRIQVLRGIADEAEFWLDAVDTVKPDVIINGDKLVASVARAQSIPIRILAGSRFKNYHFWAHNEYFENPAVEQAYLNDDGQSAGDEAVETPYASHMNFRKAFVKNTGYLSFFKEAAQIFARKVYWKLRGYEKGRTLNVLEGVKYAWNRRADFREMTSARITPLARLEGNAFVFYPLHTEPEVALHTLSPEYFYQLETIAAVARDLPADTMLAVKETYAAVGRRSLGFYDQIHEFKNVAMLDMMEFGLDVVRKSAAVVTISGTAGFEGAVMGKPVLSFGHHNLYNFLPHVYQIRSAEDVGTALRAALGSSFCAERAKEDGKRFLRAVVATSFDLSGYDYTRPEQVEDGAAQHAANALVESIR